MPDFPVLTAKQFVEWVTGTERRELLDGLCSLGDADRKRFAKETAAAHQAARRAESATWRFDLAVAATCGWTEAKRIARQFAWWSNALAEIEDDLVTVIAARKPDWAQKWVERELEGQRTNWSAVRQLIREGACPRPTTDVYIQKLISTSAGASGDRESTLAQRLRDDPALFEYEIWRIFEIDPGEGALFPYDDEDTWNALGSWGGALLALAADGTIDRMRLLQATHETLRRGLQQKDTGFHLRLIERLAPAPAERAALSDVYLDLLSHRADPVVRFALTSCETLLKEGALAPRDVLHRITPALQREKKGPAEAALKLIRRLVKSDASLAQDAARAAAEALRHPDSGIHEKTLDLLEELDAGEAVAAHLDFVAPSQRARAEALARTTGVSASPSVDVEEILARARAIDADTRRVFGIDPLLAALERGEEPPRHVPSEHVPRLAGREEVRPIGDFTELVDTLLFVSEGRPEPVDVERALDGMSRLAARRPADWQERTAALRKSATRQAVDMADQSVVAGVIRSLVAHWLQGGAPALRTEGMPEDFLAQRASEIMMRISEKRAAPMLALPTHGPWIDPRRLVERVREYAQTPMPLGRADFVQALLRLAPEHREEALRAAADLAGEEGAVVRYALGGDEPVRGHHWVVWAAASRARIPFADDLNLAGTAASNLTMGIGPVTYRWSVRMQKHRYVVAPDYFVDIAVEPTRESHDDWPLPLFWSRERRWIIGSSLDVLHRATVRPIDPTPSLIDGVHSIMDRVFRPASSLTPTAAYLHALLDPHAPSSELAALALALALISQDADARTMAVDVALAMIGDGRLRGDELGRVYARLWPTEGLLKLGRVAAAAQAVAAESRAHQIAGARLLEELMVSFQPPAPKDLHHLLGAYREILAATGRSCDPRLQPLLTSVTGSGKTPKLAREVLTMPGSRAADALATAHILTTRMWSAEAIASAFGFARLSR